MAERNTKQNSISTEDKEDEVPRTNSSQYGDRLNHNHQSNYNARTVDFAGAVRNFDSRSNGSNLSETKPVSTDSDSDGYYDSICDDSGSEGNHNFPVDEMLESRSTNGVGSKNGNSQTRRRVTWMDSSNDDDWKENWDDSKYFDPPTANTFSTSSFISTGSMDSIFRHMKMMEQKVQDLQQEVGKVGEETSSRISTISRRNSCMIRTSLILKDIDFSDELGSDTKYPADCYSLITLNGPTGYNWPLKRLKFFLFGLLVFSFQISFLVLMLMSRTFLDASDIEIDNPIERFLQFIPSNSKTVIRVSQIITLMTYTIFPDASLMDVFRAYQYFPIRSKATKDDPVKGMILSCFLRACQGYLATIAVFLVVITTPSVVDIILNFTALSFISSLDDEAFGLAKSGVFGSDLRKEVERIEDAKLPACFRQENTLRLYWKVLGSVGGILFTLLFFVIGFQNSATWWVTPTFRVEFKEETGLKLYSGCYGISSDTKYGNRFAYIRETENSATAFGYCTKDRRWILFKDFEDNANPCFVGENELARSSATEFFDIAKSFEELWFYPSSTTPIDLFFFPDSDIESLHCDMYLGDGICDKSLNIPGFQYDNGDCCAATCSSNPNCGRKGADSIFGISNVSDYGYPHCDNPQMKPVTIHLNDIVSSRDAQFDINWDSACKLDLAKRQDEWRTIPPEKPRLFLYCNDAYVLTLNIEESMKENAETVWIEDGANCILGIRNATSAPISGKKDTELYSFYCDDPIWFVNYTIFHGSESTTEADQVEMLTQHSSENEFQNFTRIPDCYFDKLGDFVDIQSIYSTSNPSHEVISWLLEDSKNNELLECEKEYFTERFAVSTVVFSMNGDVTMLNHDFQQCTWPWVDCSNLGWVNGLNLQNSLLKGQIPKDLTILSQLEQLNLCTNQITSIPSEIGMLKNLQKLYLHDNAIESIPIEVGSAKKLETLWLNGNKISYLPSEIGLLTNLRDLELASNELTSIPSEIGLITNLGALWLGNNELTLIPTEIGSLKNLEFFWSNDNKIASLPTEFGLLTNLEAISLSSNNFTIVPHELFSLTNLKEISLGNSKLTNLPSEIWTMTDLTRLVFPTNLISSIPTEFGLLTDLKQLYLYENQIVSIPTQIGQMTALERLYLQQNNITFIPSEIGLMSNLRRLYLGNNQITSIPSEIGLLTNLRLLHLNNNQIASIPSEIGLISDLDELYLNDNMISSFPSEIGSMTNLEVLILNNNDLSSDSIPREIEELCSSNGLILCELEDDSSQSRS